MAREPLADAFFGFPDAEEAGLDFVSDILDLLEYPAFVVDKHLSLVASNLQGRDTLAWAESGRAAPGSQEPGSLPPSLAGIVAGRGRKRVQEIVKDVAVVEDPPFMFDVLVSKGRIRGESYTFLVLMNASAVKKPGRADALTRLLAGCRGGAFVAGRNVKFVAINDTFLDLTGFSRKELIGRHFNEFNTSEQALAYGRVLAGMIESPRVLRIPTVTYSTVRRGAFVSSMNCWTLTGKRGEALGVAVVGGFRSRPRPDLAQVERRHILLEKAADLMSEAIFITDLDGRILVKNPAAENMLAAGADDRVFNIKTDVPWEIPGSIDSVFEGLAKGREQVLFNTGVALPSHKAILKVRVFALRRVGDFIHEMVFVCEDISQEEYLKQTLFRTTRRLSEDKALRDKVLQNVDIPYAVVDEDLTVLDANDATCRRFGFTREEVLGSSLTDLNPNIAGSGLTRLILATIETGKIMRSPDYPHMTREGRHLTLTLTAIPVELAGRRACVTIAESESDPRMVELLSDLKARAEMGDTVIGGVDEGIFIIDREGTFLEANEGAARGSAMPREHIVGRNVRDLIALSEEQDLFSSMWKELLTIEKPFRSGLVRSRSRVDGLEQFVDCSAYPLRGSGGEVEKFLVIVRYLREIKGLEQQLAEYTANLERMVGEKTRGLSDSNAMLASMAHRVATTARSGDIIAAMTGREALVEAFLKQAADVLGCEYVALFLRDGGAGRPAVKRYSRGAEPDGDRDVREAIDGALAEVMLEQAPAERVWAPMDNLILSQFSSGNVGGVFAGLKSAGRFSSTDVDLAHLLCTQLSFALPMASYVADQKKERQRAECLRRIAFRIAGVASVKDAVRIVAEEVSQVVGVDRFFWLVSEQGGRVWLSEIFRRDGREPAATASLRLGEEAAGLSAMPGAREIKCEKIAGGAGALLGDCRFVDRGEEGGLARALCRRMIDRGLIEGDGGSCVVFPVHLTPDAQSHLCAYSAVPGAFPEDDVCFMCLAASSVGGVWMQADAASSIRRLETTGETMNELVHDFRYPMSRVTGLLRRLASGELDRESGMESAKSALADLERLAGLSREFIDLGRPGRSRPEFTDILQVLEDSLAVAGEDLERKRVKVERDLSRSEPLPPVFVNQGDVSGYS